MNLDWLKRSMPRSLYGRAALILVIPIAGLVLAVSILFVQRYFEDVTRQLTYGVALEIREIVEQIDAAPTLTAGIHAAQSLADTLDMTLAIPVTPQADSRRSFYDVSGFAVIDTLQENLPGVRSVDLQSSNRRVEVQVETRHGLVDLSFRRLRASAVNPHQFLVLLASIGVLMTGVAFLSLRNQLRPITRLADAANAFGRGRAVFYRPSGAQEVRAAGLAFLDMRARILRQIEQRTLMLSGVSHDLRTPLTRMKLTLEMMEPDADVTDLKNDVTEMEQLVDAFLDFARADQLGDPEPVSPAELAQAVVGKATRHGDDVVLSLVGEPGARVVLRRAAVERALDNLVGNALRYGNRALVSVELRERQVIFRVEDDGPGIPENLREEAMKPFTRLDPARNQDRGSGVGLGLAIAQDIARRHGGSLRLGVSERLGGLKVELFLAR